MSIDDAPFCGFSLASSHLTTKYLAILPQPSLTLINTSKSNLPSICRRPSRYPSYFYRGGHHRNTAQHRQLEVQWTPPVCTTRLDHEFHVTIICRLSFCNAAAFESLDAKGKSEETFASFDSPPDAVISDVKQSNSLSTPHTERRSNPSMEADTNKQNEPDASTKTNI